MNSPVKARAAKTTPVPTTSPSSHVPPPPNGKTTHAMPGPVGPSALVRLRAALGWSRALMGQVVNCSDRAIVNWEQGEPISAIYAAKLRELQSVYEELKELMKPGEIGRWLTAENEEFDGQSPADLVRRGETGRLWQSLFYLRSGQPD